MPCLSTLSLRPEQNGAGDFVSVPLVFVCAACPDTRGALGGEERKIVQILRAAQQKGTVRRACGFFF